jgi:hypothetical protein
MDDFSQVAVHALPRNNVSSSAAHSSTLMVNGGSSALAPLEVTLPASVTSVRPHEVISTTAIEAGLLRTLGKRWSALRTPERFYVHLAEGLRLRNAVLVDCLPQPLKCIDDMRVALRRVLEVLEPHVRERRLVVPFVGDWPVFTMVHRLLYHESESLGPIAGLVAPLSAQFHAGKSLRKATLVTFHRRIFKPLYRALHGDTHRPLPAHGRNDDLNRHLCEILWIGWCECKENILARLADGRRSLGVTYLLSSTTCCRCAWTSTTCAAPTTSTPIKSCCRSCCAR